MALSWAEERQGGKFVVLPTPCFHTLRLPACHPRAVYGKVLKLLGDARMSVFCGDNVTRVCRVRGKMKNRVWVRKQDVVLVAKWAGFTSDDKADIIHKYTDDEVKTLRKRGEIPDKFVGEMEEPTVTTAATAKVDEDSDDDIVFEAADIDAI